MPPRGSPFFYGHRHCSPRGPTPAARGGGSLRHAPGDVAGTVPDRIVPPGRSHPHPPGGLAPITLRKATPGVVWGALRADGDPRDLAVRPRPSPVAPPKVLSPVGRQAHGAPFLSPPSLNGIRTRQGGLRCSNVSPPRSL